MNRIPKNKISRAGSIVACCALAGMISASLLHGSIVGYLRIDCLGSAESSDTVVSVPFRNSAEFAGAIGAADMTNGQTVLYFGSAIGAADEFSTAPHFVQFRSGVATGHRFPVIENTAHSITVNTGAETLTGLKAADLVQVVANWTLDQLLPPATQTTVHVSTGVLPNQRQTEVLLFDTTSNGIELSPDRVFFLTAAGWKQATRGYPDAGDTIIESGAAFVIRHPPGAVNTEFIAFSVVEEGDFASVIKSRTEGPQDNTLSLMRPVPTALSDIDLESVFETSASNDPVDRKDQLFVFGTTSETVNTFPSTKYFRTAAGWIEDDGSTYPVSDATLIPAGSALVIRKGAGAGGAQVWLNSARY